MTTLGPLLVISQLQMKYSKDLTQRMQGFILQSAAEVTQAEAHFTATSRVLICLSHSGKQLHNSDHRQLTKYIDVNTIWDL